MQNRKKHLDIYLIILTVFVITCSVLRTVAAMTRLDYSYGLYSNSVLITVSDWITFSGCVILLSYLATAPRGARYHGSFNNEQTYVPSALVAASLIFLAISLFSSTVRSIRPFHPDKLRDITVIMSLISAVLAIISVYYFFLNAYIKDTASTRRASASFTAILFLCVYPAYLYFSDTLPINAPNKVVDQMAFLFCALFFLYEARISLGRDRWNIYAAFGMISALLCSYSAIPSLIVYFAKGEMISNSLAENALTLSLFIFIVSRLLLMRILPNDAKTELVVRITEHSEAKRKEIGDSDIIQPEDGEQMEFEMLVMTDNPDSTEESSKTKNADFENYAHDEDNAVESYETAEELVGITEAEDDADEKENDAAEITTENKE